MLEGIFLSLFFLLLVVFLSFLLESCFFLLWDRVHSMKSLMGYLMYSDLLSMWAVPKECNLLMICFSNVSWDLAYVVFSPLLDKPESTSDHWDSCCFSFHVFKILVLWKFFYCFKRGVFFLSLGIDISMSSCRQVLFSLSFTSMSGLFAMISLSECLHWHVPEYGHFIGKWSFLCSKKIWVPLTFLKVYCLLYILLSQVFIHWLGGMWACSWCHRYWQANTCGRSWN